MLAKVEGKVVFIAGAIPGEEVKIRITRATSQAAWADVVEVVTPSPDRREPRCDPTCGGMAYAHIRYERQLRLKGEVIADALRRIGSISLPAPPVVAGSPETGYRLRARLHLRRGQVGFFRTGSHDLCEAGPTGQVLPDALEATKRIVASLASRSAECEAVVLTENVAATERVLHLEPKEGARLDDLVGRLSLAPTLGGLSTDRRGRTVAIAGTASVSDTAAQVFGETPPVPGATTWSRQASSFFQGNRYLLGGLVSSVLGHARGGRFVDLYAGVGLFAVALAARGAAGLAVEGDRSSGADLDANAAPWRDRLHVVHAPVEIVAAERVDPVPDVVVLDPPRAGVSPDALAGLLRWNAPRIVYVSCDPPTLARDARRIVAAGYSLGAVSAFDLFPNTPHVETVACFDR
jgi:23S rRNA (uracil1939-C5)-methyltransferase